MKGLYNNVFFYLQSMCPDCQSNKTELILYVGQDNSHMCQKCQSEIADLGKFVTFGDLMVCIHQFLWLTTDTIFYKTRIRLI